MLILVRGEYFVVFDAFETSPLKLEMKRKIIEVVGNKLHGCVDKLCWSFRTFIV